MSRLLVFLRSLVADPRRRMAAGIGVIALFAVVGAIAPSPVPTPGSPASYGIVEPGTIVRVVGGTIAVIALIVVSLRLMKRAGLGTSTRAGTALSLVETLPLGERRVLYLIAIGERRIIVGASPAGMSAVGEVGADEIAAADRSTEVPADFLEQLRVAAERRR